MQFQLGSTLFEIGSIWYDRKQRPWRSLYKRSNETQKWTFITSASSVLDIGRYYFDDATIAHLKRIARGHARCECREIASRDHTRHGRNGRLSGFVVEPWFS